MGFLGLKSKKQAKQQQQPQQLQSTEANVNNNVNANVNVNTNANTKTNKSKSKTLDAEYSDDTITLETSTVISPSTSSGEEDSSHSDTNSNDDGATTTATATATTTATVTTTTSSDIKDPFADVRDRMEALSLHHRMVHAYHSDKNNKNNKHSHATQDFGEPVIPFFAALTTYLGYAALIFVGHVRDFCAKLFRSGRYVPNSKNSACPADDDRYYAPLLKSFENFYTKRLYHRIQDCFNRPLASSPGANVNVLERISYDGNKTMQVLGKLENLSKDEAKVYTNSKHYAVVSGERVTRKCLNLGSYNYLGFADDWQVTCRKGVMESLNGLPVSMGSSRMECGTSVLHDRVEKIVAEFIGKEDAMVVNMGFNTNATTIPALMGRGDLIVSDELNHTSIVNGARTSGSAIRCFRHNDTKHLEEILKEAIVMGQPRTRRPWKRIMVIVEGIYSMEGEYCDLRNVVKVCKEYGAYVYLDEAHSIGAMGATGRGCCEYTGVDPKDVDVMMGTFTKSFGGMGGYIAGSMDVIQFLRGKCAASTYHNSLSPTVCQQIISSFEVSFHCTVLYFV